MLTLNKRDLAWLVVPLALSGATSATLVSAVVAPEHRSILDLDWLPILGCAGAAMFGGLIGTLFAVHKAGEEGKELNIQLQVGLDLGRAVILALVVYGAFAFYKWPPEPLPGVLALFGMAGQKVLDPLLKAATNVITAASDRILGKPKE